MEKRKKKTTEQQDTTTKSSRVSRKKKHKSTLVNVWKNREKTHILVLIFALIGAFMVDVLKILKNLILSIFVICLVCALCGAIFVWTKIQPYYKEYNEFAEEQVENSTYDTFKLDESTYIYDSNGEILVKLRGEQDSAYLEYKDIPVDVVNAFIAVEDRSFWDNPGIDVKGLVRVGVDFIRTHGDEMHGASTITQQLARCVFLSHEVSIERKAKEMLIALKLTKKYSKQEIVEFYVNDVCFANAVYGIEAAASAYFNKTTKELTLSEIAYLSAIPNSPEYYNPYKYPERALERRDKILGDMRELGYITEKEYQAALSEEINIERPSYSFNDNMSTYAIDCATRYIMRLNNFEFRYHFESMTDYTNYKKEYSEAYSVANMDLVTGGYKVYTTLNKDIQSNIQQLLDENLMFDSEIDENTGVYSLQGAITVVDNSTGKVIAVVGGRTQEDIDNQNYTLNRAYQSPRQPGSSIKPLVVYTPALINGYRPTSMVQNIDVNKAKEKV